MGYNPEQTTWMNPSIEYLFDDDIREYDIADAGYSLIKQFKLLPESEIQRLGRLDKGIERHIEVGKMQRDNKEFSNRLLKAFRDARFYFIETNKLTDDKIISVKKDAIFTIGEVNRTKFGQVVFVPKNIYSSYLRFPNIQNLEIYYNKNGIDFKQINDHSVAKHRLYTVEFLNTFIHKMEYKDHSLKRFMIDHIMKYKTMALEEEYYLEFNNKSENINPIFNYRELLIPLLLLVQKEIR